MSKLENELRQVDYWHQLIKPANADADRLYAQLTLAEIAEALDAQSVPSMVKELCDVVVTARAGFVYSKLSFHSKYYDLKERAALELIDSLTDGYAANAMRAVNESNFSKLILPHEIEEAAEHFAALGIDVRIEPLSDGDYYGAYSTHEQTVNGKLYEANKLLKGPKYSPVDESCHFWL